MLDNEKKTQELHSQINALEIRLEELKRQLRVTKNGIDVSSNPSTEAQCKRSEDSPAVLTDRNWNWPLEMVEYQRYGRQMIMPEIGLHGQLNLKNAAVLVVGLGGLGCPAAAYLAGAGIGRIGLVDGDKVELSNLHRQILHSIENVGQFKVNSAVDRLRQLNPDVNYIAYPEHLDPPTALKTFDSYDLILDCTDHPASRYLISDAAVLSKRPLVSASALRTEGQLMVLNHPPRCNKSGQGGPCYRCIFPKPPPADSVTSCGEGGILGPVVGVMGVLMALEAIKIISQRIPNLNEDVDGGDHSSSGDVPSMLLFSAYNNPQFRSVRLRGKRPQCPSCSAQPSITAKSLVSGSFDYVTFCESTTPLNMLDENERISAKELQSVRGNSSAQALVLDVREKVQYDICHLEESVNIPYSSIESLLSHKSSQNTDVPTDLSDILDGSSRNDIYVLCRFGNNSQLAVRKLKELGIDNNGERYIGDVKGGLRAWKTEVDPQWPEY